MQIKTLVLLGVAISALPVAAKAADSYPPYAPPMTYDAAPPPVRLAAYGLPPHEVEAIVRSMGLRPIAPPLRRPRVYVVDAVDARGFRVRAIVHARRGDVLAVRPVYVAPPRYAVYPVHPRYGAVVTPEDDDIDVDVNVDVDVDVDLDRDARRPPVASRTVPESAAPRYEAAPRATKALAQPVVKSAKADPAAAPTPRPRPAGADARAEQTASAPTGPIRKIEIKKQEPAPETAAKPETKPENKPEGKPAEVTVPVAPLL